MKMLIEGIETGKPVLLNYFFNNTAEYVYIGMILNFIDTKLSFYIKNVWLQK